VNKLTYFLPDEVIQVPIHSSHLAESLPSKQVKVNYSAHTHCQQARQESLCKKLSYPYVLLIFRWNACGGDHLRKTVCKRWGWNHPAKQGGVWQGSGWHEIEVVRRSHWAVQQPEREPSTQQHQDLICDV